MVSIWSHVIVKPGKNDYLRGWSESNVMENIDNRKSLFILKGGILDFLGWRGLADPCMGGEHNLVAEKGARM